MPLLAPWASPVRVRRARRARRAPARAMARATGEAPFGDLSVGVFSCRLGGSWSPDFGSLSRNLAVEGLVFGV